MADSTQARETLKLASALGSVDIVERMTVVYSQRAGFDEDTASNLGMVVREAAVNAIVHGNRYSESKQVTATFLLSDETLTVQLADEGGGLDPASIPDPLAPENLLRTSGRGVFLMRAFMDEVHFRQLSPGTEITMIKRRPPVVESRQSNPGEHSQ